MSRRNFLLVLAYDGTGFLGWQRLPDGARSVQGTVEAALAELLGEAVEITGAGRTDAGVHAEGQAASFHSRTALAPEAIAAALGEKFPADLKCLSCREVDPRFHARFRAKGKVYRYRLHAGEAPDPTLRRFSHHVRGPLDLAAMRRAGAMLEGERDFRVLSNEKEKTDTVRRLDSVRIETAPSPGGELVDMIFEGSGFLRNQVRVMAGLLLEVGQGRRKCGDIPAMLAAGNRGEAPGALGPHGLSLLEVRYSEDSFVSPARDARPALRRPRTAR